MTEENAPPSPEMVVAWLDRKAWSASTWIDDHGRKAKKPRPDWDIVFHEEDVEMIAYIRIAFAKAVERRNSAA